MPNPDFAARFVGPSLARMPRARIVDATRPAESLRVLVFGESAALGDPEPAFGFSRFLQALLEARLPDRRVEVINTAVTALNSHAILDVASDSQRLQADFWVVYPGNNEVIGPFGPAAVPSGVPPSRALIRWGLAVRRTALGQWLADRQAVTAGGLSLTQRWAGLETFLDRKVPPDSPGLDRVYDHYASNLREIATCGLRSGAKVIVGTMAVNLPDCPPLGSRWNLETNAPALAQWARAVAKALEADQGADVDAAVDAWIQAAALRPEDAETRHHLGLARLSAGDPTGGRTDLEASRDLDPLRFRADSRIQEITRDTARSFPTNTVRLVDAARQLTGLDPDRPPGADLFFEHVHLRPEGNYALARMFASEILDLIGEPPGTGAWLSYEGSLERLGWTPYAAARLWGQARTATQRPPFSRQSNAGLRDRYLDDRIAEANAAARALGLPSAIASVAGTVRQHPEDWELREQLARLHQLAGQWLQATAEGREVVSRAPGHVVGWYQLGESLSQAGHRDGAAAAYREALALRSDFIEARVGLARVLAEQGQWALALDELDTVLRDVPDHLVARVNRALTLMGLERFDEAETTLRAAATAHPDAREVVFLKLGVDHR